MRDVAKNNNGGRWNISNLLSVSGEGVLTSGFSRQEAKGTKTSNQEPVVRSQKSEVRASEDQWSVVSERPEISSNGGRRF